MSWIRYYSRKIFGPLHGSINLPPERAQKYMNATRIAYFFSASSLAIYIWMKSEGIQKKVLESGTPTIQDHSGAHEAFRRSKAEKGSLYTYVPGQGLFKEELTREKYLEQLERESLERAKEAQRKVLEEGRSLPPGAIKVI